MSRFLNLQSQIVISEQTGKRRVMTTISRDESLEVNFILTAEDAEQWGAKLMFLAEECRKKTSQTEEVYSQKIRNLKKRLVKLFTKR